VPNGSLGKQFDAMHAFHAAKSIKACLGRGRPKETHEQLRWYFTHPTTAEAFAADFGGMLKKVPC